MSPKQTAESAEFDLEVASPESTLDEFIEVGESEETASEDKLTIIEVADSLARGVGGLYSDRLSVAWLLGQEVGALPKIDDFRIVYSTRVFSSTIQALCGALEKNRASLSDGVSEAASPYRELGEIVSELEEPRPNALGRFLLGEENVHPSHRLQFREERERLLSRCQEVMDEADIG